MSSFTVCGVAVLSLVLLLLLRGSNTAYLPALRLAVGVVLLGSALFMLAPIVLRVKRLFDTAGVGEGGERLLRAAGIAMLCEITALLSEGCGENTVADGVIFVGKIEILLLALPLVDEVMALVARLLA